MKTLIIILTFVVSLLSVGCFSEIEKKIYVAHELSKEYQELASEYLNMSFKYREINPKKSDSLYIKYLEYDSLSKKQIFIRDSVRLYYKEESFKRKIKKQLN